MIYKRQMYHKGFFPFLVVDQLPKSVRSLPNLQFSNLLLDMCKLLQASSRNLLWVATPLYPSGENYSISLDLLAFIGCLISLLLLIFVLYFQTQNVWSLSFT